MVSLTENAAARIKEIVANAGPGTDNHMMMAVLRLAAKWRSQLIANTIVARDGTSIQQGLFAGMKYLDKVSEGALAARLVGSYESELHPYLSSFLEGGLEEVVDIGCAEGYYAVGLARLASELQVHAFDIDETARRLCGELAAINGVADRVHIAGEFSGDDFAAHVGRRTLFIVDIEGSERELLDPVRWPALKHLPLLVETHPGASPGITRELVRRFVDSHMISLVHQQPKSTALPDWLNELGHMDGLMAVWEWRANPTPWLVMKPKA